MSDSFFYKRIVQERSAHHNTQTYITIRCGYIEKLSPFCGKEVHSTAHKHRAQHVVDVSQNGYVVQDVVDTT